MNTKLVLWGTVLLLVAGTAYITVLEWSNPEHARAARPCGHGSSPASSSPCRPARPDSTRVDIGLMHDETWLGMDILMFIGGGPAGTAGGIKVTTFAVLFFIMVTELRGEGAVNIFGKRLSRAVHRQAITVVLIAVAAVVTRRRAADAPHRRGPGSGAVRERVGLRHRRALHRDHRGSSGCRAARARRS